MNRRFEIKAPVDGVVVESCVQSGLRQIGYWAVVREREDGALEIGEQEQPRVRTLLNDAALTRGLALAAEKHPLLFARLLTGTADAAIGDVLIQLAVLGEVRYG